MIAVLSWLVLAGHIPGYSQELIVYSEEDVIDFTYEDIMAEIFEDDEETIKSENITEKHPLLTIINTKPHSMSLLVKPTYYYPDTMIRLLYERVNVRRKLGMAHLTDPVIEFLPMQKEIERCDLTELPRGRYIVCGEAMVKGEVYQASCCEINIDRIQHRSECLVTILVYYITLVTILVYYTPWLLS